MALMLAAIPYWPAQSTSASLASIFARVQLLSGLSAVHEAMRRRLFDLFNLHVYKFTNFVVDKDESFFYEFTVFRTNKQQNKYY